MLNTFDLVFPSNLFSYGVIVLNLTNITVYIMRHGITTNRLGQVTMQIVIIMPRIIDNWYADMTKNLPKTKSTASVSLTNLFIILPCGVMSKNSSFVCSTPWSDF